MGEQLWPPEDDDADTRVVSSFVEWDGVVWVVEAAELNLDQGRAKLHLRADGVTAADTDLPRWH
jgi:hypothetical protein